ncbi:TPA: glycosyltransferase family 4 protein [Enterococcus faecium]|uniref:glycosyltransferase family 4 protein n=1 Tax=Enterococcus faecium TaxID=1352 RepID=UPI00145BFE28|nr:glycosyltransferase family 4 protein [Enterococcus faecium]MCH3236886.1 glycosyltransferase family 4 protein [Enterococcus faecium]MCZ1310302.1 glycosyltransferase family 4 protein [Enterococcus faecium]MCZ1359053.1 glycosyltransferase family 4 protein [Enterococcus faecium]NMO48161.1 glycosyltransferase family 4 protein [Enterococcus faecium]HBM5401549.1 glycosyltransferase family 4 protein [Enterococcus faecium]
MHIDVAFFLDNGLHQGVDYRFPERGNPGVGGTQYMFWSVAYFLRKKYKDIGVHLIAQRIENMPAGLNVHQADNEIDAVKLANELNIDFLVLRGPTKNKLLFDYIEKYKVKCVFWSHNFENYEFCQLADNCEFVVKNVCVGKEQYERLYDHKIFSKSTYIYNAIDFENYLLENKKKDGKVVCYMGSLTPRKGFHRLARNWKKILQQVPDAQLYVLGASNLYSKQSQTVKASVLSKYEKKNMRYLSNNGKLLPGVKFFGVVSGKEKIALLNAANIGVPNPTAVGETFCIVAVEFQALHVPVVTIKKNGFLDTVRDRKTGYLFKNDREFVRYVVDLLNDEEQQGKIGAAASQFVRKEFTFDRACEAWRNLFEELKYNKCSYVNQFSNQHLSNNFKWLRVLCKRIPFMPSLLYFEFIAHRVYVLIKEIKK